jgi:hypothetical protein
VTSRTPQRIENRACNHQGILTTAGIPASHEAEAIVLDLM